MGSVIEIIATPCSAVSCVSLILLDGDAVTRQPYAFLSPSHLFLFLAQLLGDIMVTEATVPRCVGVPRDVDS